MKQSLLILVFLSLTEAFGSSAVVKVKSFLCDKPEVERVGSGILFMKEESYFALTSAHVIFHGDQNERVCHTLHYEDAPSVSGTLLAANFANGLALLRVKGPGDLMRDGALPFSALEQGAALLPGNEATLAGYPFGSNTSLRDEVSRILNASSNRSILPLVDKVIEVKGHTEFGMSGGALLTPKGNLLGMVSHQYLSQQPGQPARQNNYSPDAPREGIVGLVIPTETIRKWLDQVFIHNPKADLKEELGSQIHRTPLVVPLGGVKFKGPKTLGGGDGVGIGGETPPERLPTSEGAPVILLSLDDSANPQPWPFKGDNAWLDEIRAHLLRHSTVAITGLEYRGVRYPVSDLLTTFNLIEHGYRPLYRVTKTQTDDVGAIEKRAKEIAAEGLGFIRQIRELSIPERGPADLLLQEISLAFEKVRDGQVDSVSDSSIADLVDPPTGSLREKGWTALYDLAFLKACDLKTSLLRLKSELKKVRG